MGNVGRWGNGFDLDCVEWAMKNNARHVFLGICLVLVWGPLSRANMVTVDITGHVTGSSFPTDIPISSAVTGSYTYSDVLSTPPFTIPGIGLGAIYSPVAFSLTFADGSTMTATDGTLNLARVFGFFDAYRVQSGASVSGTGVFAGMDYLGAVFERYDSSGTALDASSHYAGFPAVLNPTDVLSLFPMDVPPLPFPPDGSYLYCGALGSEYRLDFVVTDLSTVPIPGALVLGAIGLACAGWRLRRRGTL
jgi:hypothetical protein